MQAPPPRADSSAQQTFLEHLLSGTCGDAPPPEVPAPLAISVRPRMAQKPPCLRQGGPGNWYQVPGQVGSEAWGRNTVGCLGRNFTRLALSPQE